MGRGDVGRARCGLVVRCDADGREVWIAKCWPGIDGARLVLCDVDCQVRARDSWLNIMII